MAFTYGEYSESGDYTIKEKKVKYVEYIESDGASYIDTGIVPTLDMTFYGDYTLTNYNHVAFGSSEIIKSYGFYQSANRVYYGGYTNITGYSLSSYGNRYQNTLTPTGYTLTDVTLGKTISGDYTHTPSGTCKHSMRLFGEPRNADGLMYFAKCKIYDFKIWNVDNELIMHLRPCLDIDDTPCMYDEVSQQYFYNQGTGTFTVGDYNLYLFADNQDNVATNLGNYRLYNMKIEGDSQGIENDRDIIDYVNCLIGDGASYINTGVSVFTGYQIDVTFETTVENHPQRGSNFYYDCIYGTSSPLYYTYDNSCGTSVGLINYDIGVRDNKTGGNGYASYSIKDNCLNKKYTLSRTLVNVSNTLPIYVFANNNNNGTNSAGAESICDNTVRIYDFKIYNAEGTLIQHLRPCLDTFKVPCMYDEVSKEYFYNQGTGTFGYKKSLRDFQPVLDKNGIPCLMDKINRKYYYDNNGNAFDSQEEVKYRRIPYLQGDGASWLDIGQFDFNSNTRLEVKVAQPEWRSVRECIINNSGNLLMTLFNVGSDRLSYRVGTPYGGDASGLRLGIKPHIFTITQTKITCDENIIANPTSYGDISSTNIYLLKEWSINTTHATAISQLYYFKIYQSDELVFDGIPALDQDNIPCMYDLVTETFFYNQGTGTFNYEIEQLECPPCDQVDCIYRAKLENSDAFKTKNFNGLLSENLIIKTKVKMARKDQSTSFFQMVGQYNVNRTYLGYNASSNEFQATFLGNNCYTSINDYEVLNDEILEVQLSKDGLYVNNTFISELSTTNFGTSFVTPLCIFQSIAYNGAFSGNSPEGDTIYYLTFEQDGEIIADFIPALDDKGVLCFYESVDGIYYYATLGTSFNYNTRVSTPIKYIESNGTQYIDTGVRITDNTDIDIVCRETTMIDYISNGLIFNLDGIKNTRNGHVSDTIVWEDLSDSGLDFDLNNITITDNCMSFNGSTSYANIQDIELWKTISNNTIEYDVELCFRFSTDETYQPIISSNYGLINVAKYIQYLQFKSTTYGLNLYNVSGVSYAINGKSFTVSCNMNDLLAYFNTTNYVLNSEASDFINAPTSDSFSIGTRLTGERFWFNGDIYSIRIYNRHLTDEERLYNHSVDVARFGVETDIITVKTGNYIMNGLYSQETYEYQDTDTTVQPNLTASEGATLTLGETYLSYLSEEEIEDATNDGWNLL